MSVASKVRTNEIGEERRGVKQNPKTKGIIMVLDIMKFSYGNSKSSPI